MKIGLVRRGYSRTGGAEVYVRRFAEAAITAGHEVVLFAGEWPPGEWKHAHIQVAGDSPRKFSTALAALRPRDRCDTLFSLERISTCDCYRAGDGVHAAWLDRRARFEPPWKPWLRRFSPKHRQVLALEKELFGANGAGCVIANSKMVRSQIERRFRYSAERIHVIYNGVPPCNTTPEARARTRHELGLRDQDYALLFAGSGWERKGLAFAFAAMNVARLGHAKLLVAGRGDRRALPRSPHVQFLGPVKEMPLLLAACDAFILPTIYEPFSNACLEALAAGLPVITTGANGFAEIIEPGVEGEVIARADDIPALATAIKNWSDVARRAAIRDRLIALGARYTVEENVRQTLAVIEKQPRGAER